MAIHTELRPDDASLALLLADAALRQSNANVTRISGILSVDNGDGSETWIGGNVNPDSNGGVTEWVGDTTVPGRPTGLSAVSAVNRVLVSWNGTLHDGVPADFDHISVFVVNDGTVESLGDLNCAGTILSKKYAEGTILEVYAVAYDAARDERGNYSPNMSEESDRITLVVEQDVDMGQLNNAAADMEQKADEAAAKADKVRSDLQAEVDKVSAKADDLSKTGDQLAGQITDIKGTVNGQRTQLTEFGQKLEGEITRGDTTVKSVSELKQTVTGLSSTVSQTTKTASDALSKATTVEQTANGLKATISKDYQTTVQADGKYSTKAELSATSDSLSSKITETTKTANGAMDKASSVEQTASTLSSKLSETAKTLDSTVQTVNTVKSTADSNKATLTQVAKTASDASSRASSVEQSLNGFKTTVSQTYGRGSNLWVNPTFDADKPQITSRVNNVTAPNGSGVNLLASRDHHNNATSFPVVPGHTYVITAHIKRLKGDKPLNAGIWYTAQTGGNSFDTYRGAESTSDLSDGWIAATWRFSCPNGKSRGCVFFQIDQSASNGPTQWYVANVVCTDVTGLQPAGDYATNSSLTQTANQIRGEVSEKYQSKNGMSSYATNSALTQKADEITGKVTEVAKTAQGNTTTISQVSQKADRINATLLQQISGKADTSRVSSLEQNLDGFKTSVAKTYQTKGDYPTEAEVQSRIDQSASSIKSTVGQTYTTLAATEALRKSATRTFTLTGAAGKAKWVKLGLSHQ